MSETTDSNASLVDSVRRLMLAELCKGPTPVGVRLDSGSMLVLALDGGGRARAQLFDPAAEPRKPQAGDPERLSLADLARLVEHGVRGAQLEQHLQQAVYCMNLYRDLAARLAAASFDEQGTLLDSYMEASRRVPGLLGRVYKEAAADGYAYYLVTQLRPGQARLSHLQVLDGYTVAHLGQDGWLDQETVRRNVEMQDLWYRAMETQRSTQQRPRP